MWLSAWLVCVGRTRLMWVGDRVGMQAGCKRDASAYDDMLAGDVAGRGVYAGDTPVALDHARQRHALSNRHTAITRTTRQRSRRIDGVHTSVCGDVETRNDVVDAAERKETLDLRGGDLLHVDAALSVEGRHPPIFLKVSSISRKLYEAHRHEAS